MPPTLKRHLISAGITFVSAFAFVLLTFLMQIDSLADLSETAVVATFSAALVAALRAGAKYLFEAYFSVKQADDE